MKRLARISLILIAPACSGVAHEPTAAARERGSAADWVMFGVQHNITPGGIRRGVLTADSAYAFRDSARDELWGVRVTIFGADGRETAALTSRSGTLNERTETVLARGSVVLVTREGNRRIETENLYFCPSAHCVGSTVKTRIQQNGTWLTGDGFSADDEMHNVELNNPRGSRRGS